MQRIDINCDMGESTSLWPYALENDLALLPYCSSINIACGFHAGDPATMHALVEQALLRNISIGAHPAFDDRANFGRTDMELPPERLYSTVIYQIGALDAFLRLHGAHLRHVKPHGALYNMAAKNAAMAQTIVSAVKDYNPALVLFALSGSELVEAAGRSNLRVASEVFADRSYQPDGSLTPRSQAGAVLDNDGQSVRQVLQMASRGSVTAVDGSEVRVKADTVCIHSDGAHALLFAKTIYSALQQQGIAVQPI